MYVLFDLEWVTAEARRSRMRDHAPAGRQDRRSQLPGTGGLLPQPHPPRQADPQTDGGPRLPGEGMPLFRKIRRRRLLEGEKPESRREEKTPPETDPREGAAAAGSRRPHPERPVPDLRRRCGLCAQDRSGAGGKEGPSQSVLCFGEPVPRRKPVPQFSELHPGRTPPLFYPDAAYPGCGRARRCPWTASSRPGRPPSTRPS